VSNFRRVACLLCTDQLNEDQSETPSTSVLAAPDEPQSQPRPSDYLIRNGSDDSCASDASDLGEEESDDKMEHRRKKVGAKDQPKRPPQVLNS
jgi:hypothetical protein